MPAGRESVVRRKITCKILHDLSLKVLIVTLAGSCAAPAACARDPDALNLFFTDELVEAPARTIDLFALSGVDCDTLLSRRHDDAPRSGELIAARNATYPIDPKRNILDDLPRGVPFALEIAAYDSEPLLIARACEVITLETAEATTIDIELRALPKCSSSASMIDLVVVLDTSTAIEVADSTRVHIDELNARVIDGGRFPTGSLFSIVTHGHTDPPVEILPPTADVTSAHAAIESLRSVHHGKPLIYDAMYTSAALARARAVCGRRPALLVLLGGVDGGSNHLFEDAAIGVIGARGDPTDDIYAFGIGLTLNAYDELNDLIPEEIGIATGAETELLRKSKLSEAASALRALVP